eukprot:7158243-Prymnesium_polylepis.1
MRERREGGRGRGRELTRVHARRRHRGSGSCRGHGSARRGVGWRSGCLRSCCRRTRARAPPWPSARQCTRWRSRTRCARCPCGAPRTARGGSRPWTREREGRVAQRKE